MAQALTRIAALAVVAMLALAGCTGDVEPPAPGPVSAVPSTPPTSAATSKVVTGEPPSAMPSLTTLAVVAARTGGHEVGTVTARVGDLWIHGDCVGGRIEIHADPVVVLPIVCDSLGDAAFMNQISISAETVITLSVAADAQTTWNLRVEQ